MNDFLRGSRTYGVAALAVSVALLAGCATRTPFEQPEPPATSQYGELPAPEVIGSGDDVQRLVAGAATVPADWWRAFRSPELDRVVEQALQANRTLVAAAASVEQANALVRARSAARLPELDATAGVGRQKHGAQFLGGFGPLPPFTYFAIGSRVSYTLDFMGGVASSIEQQAALAEYQRRQFDAARLAVSGNAVLQALEIASLRTQLRTVEELLERDRENLRLVQVAYEAGAATRLDVSTARSQLASDETLVPPLRQALGVARDALAVILGTTPSALDELVEPDLARLTLPPELPLSVPSELAHRRPDILAAEAQLRAATAAVGVAKANLYPQVTLAASGGMESIAASSLFDSASNVFGLTGGLVGPLFDGGRRRAERDAALSALEASRANYEQTVLTAFSQVADVLHALEQDAAQLQAQASAEAAAREAVELTRRAWTEGAVGVLQVLDAERRYQQARLGYVRAQAQRYVDTAHFFLALGPGV